VLKIPKSLIVDPRPKRISELPRDERPNLYWIQTFDDGLGRNPEISALSMRIIAMWSQVDVAFGDLFVSIIGVNRKPATAAYLAINAAKTQKDCLKAAAKKALTKSDHAFVCLLMDIYDEIYAYRNHLAHGIFAFPKPQPLGLCGITSSYYFIATSANIFDSQDEGFTEEVDEQDTVIYKISDLEHILSCVMWFLDVVRSCNQKVHAIVHRRRLRTISVCNELWQEPRIVLARSRQTKNPKNDPSTTGQSPSPEAPVDPQSGAKPS
jgi:hypothetical protein